MSVNAFFIIGAMSDEKISNFINRFFIFKSDQYGNHTNKSLGIN